MIRQKRRRRNLFILIGFATIAILAFYNGLVVRNYNVSTNKLLKNQSARIVLISDLHSHVHGNNQKNIVNLIRKQNPDIIALAGDIADDIVPIEGTKLFLEAIKDIAPCYYVTGNHEIWSNEVDYIKNVFRDYGVSVLESNYEELIINGNKFIIAGVDDPAIERYKDHDYDWAEEMHNAFLKLEDQPGYKILLSHRPEPIDIYRKLPIDMVLSGHSHGGQVRIPILLNGLLAPNQGWFPKYAGGLYEHEELNHVVSRGVSYNPRLPRIFNPPEVVVIDIIGVKEEG